MEEVSAWARQGTAQVIECYEICYCENAKLFDPALYLKSDMPMGLE